MKQSWKAIRGCGSYSVRNKLGKEKKLNRLLHEIFREYARKNVQYYHSLQEWIFYYNERQNVSAILPALLKTCEEAFVECPLRRKMKGVESTRGARVDYWAQYDEKTTLLIETKQNYLSAHSSNFNEAFKKKWDNLKEQLYSIKKPEILNTLVIPSTRVVYKIGIQQSVFYSCRETEEKCWISKHEVEALVCKISNDKMIDADWTGVWYTPDKVTYDEDQKKYNHYPACFWAVKAERIDLYKERERKK